MEERIMKKIDDFSQKLIRRFGPKVRTKIVEVSTDTRQEIIQEVLKTAKICAMIGICAVPLFCGKNTTSASILADPDRAINIVYNEIHVVNNYKGGN